MTAVQDIELEIELEELRKKHKGDSSEFVPGGDMADVFDGGGFGVSSTSVYVPLYHSKTGVTSLVRANEAKRKCMEKLPDGTRAFTTKPVNPAWKYEYDPLIKGPRLVPEMGFKCYLHPESEHRQMCDELGLNSQECNKANLPTVFQQQAHMRSRHREEWKTIEMHETRAREDRNFNAMMALAGNRTEASTGSLNAYVCDMPGCSRFFDTAQGLTLHKSRDHKE